MFANITCDTLSMGCLYNIYIDFQLTVGLGADVKNGFTWKIIIVLKVSGGHGE